ncbi:unnamed protein product [Soboliphyme baturini]|uniref:RING-type domain-containing protein n=1 Tax=Soboliphyme baturini TaxID=241478 RepID=A0A183IAH1_9BILA|nr:unnamed protein product [Soboliphyme baturini]
MPPTTMYCKEMFHQVVRGYNRDNFDRNLTNKYCKAAMQQPSCNICNKLWEGKIRILRCGHSICEKCASDLLSANDNRERFIKCMRCGKISHCNNGVEDLWRNYMLEEAIEMFRSNAAVATNGDNDKQGNGVGGSSEDSALQQ